MLSNAPSALLFVLATLTTLPHGERIVNCGRSAGIYRLALGPMKNFQYIIESDGLALAVDAAWDIHALSDYITKQGLKLVGGLYTHAHADHVGTKMGREPKQGAEELLRLLPEEDRSLPSFLESETTPHIWIGDGDLVDAQKATRIKTELWTSVRDGDVIKQLGERASIVVLETPGHSKGGVSYYVRLQGHGDSSCSHGVLIAGDTLFVGNVGRTDLPGANATELKMSLSRLAQLPKRTKVLPGHDYGPRMISTIEDEIASNRVMHAARAEFAAGSLKPLPASITKAFATQSGPSGEL